MDGRCEQTTIERLKRGWISRVASLVLSFLLPLTTMPTMAWALPHGGIVTKGGATLSYSTGRLLVNQSTSSASYSWSSYNVGTSQTVTYKTPGAKSVSMNYVGGTTPALISGKVTSNGILYFMDANGIVFGQGSEISAAGVRAYGASSSSSAPLGAVTNAGTLSVAPGGEVVLVGTSVANSGTITAPGGDVVMASGKMVTLSQTSGSSFSVMTSGGGSVYDSGVVSAETVGGKTGQIVLQSGMGSGTTTLETTAVLDASAPNGGNGGAITVNGNTVLTYGPSPFNVSAPYGVAGKVVIDPGTALSLSNIDINQSAYLNTSISLSANINMADGTLSNGTNPYAWTPLGTSSSPFIGTFNGNGYTVSGYAIASASNDVGFIGYLGSGGTVKNLGVRGTINASGNCVGGVVGYNSGTVETSYNTGSVNGGFYVGGVVGYNSGTVETSYNMGSVSTVANYYPGGVAGVNFGTVEYSYNTGSVSGSGGGGVSGFNGGTVETSYNTGSVSGSSFVAGGIVGYNFGTVKTSYNTGGVSDSGYVGGIVGYNADTASDNYFLASSSTYALGNSTTSSGTNGTNIALSTSSSFGTASNLSNLGTFNTWNSTIGAFISSATSAPWFEGSVVSGSGTMTAPMLVGVMPAVTVAGNSQKVTYDGNPHSPGITQTVTDGATPLLSSDITYSGTNVGSYNPILSGTTKPTSQAETATFVSGTLTITPAPLTAATTGSKTYDGTANLTLTSSNTTFTGVDGQTATLNTSLSGTLSSANVGSNLGGTFSLKGNDLTGQNDFCVSNYTLPTTFTGGAITRATLTETANPASMTYGGTVPTLSGTLSSPSISSTEIPNLVTASWSTSATKTSNVGTYSIVPTLSYGTNTDGTGVVPGDFTLSPASTNGSALTVNPAPLTVTLSSVDKTYDGSSVAYLVGAAASETANGLTQSISPNVTVSGFVNGDSGSFVAATGSYSSGGHPVANVGSGYTVSVPVSPGSFSAGNGTLLSNYSVDGVRLTGANTATLTGTGSITPATISLTTTAVKTYDGTAGIILTSSDTTILGVPTGQAGSLGKPLPATLSSSSDGTNLGGTVSLSSEDLTGNAAFLSALGAGDYLFSPNFTGGSILSLSSSPIVPAAQTSSANISQLSAPSGLNGVASQAGSPASSLPSLAVPLSGNFGSSPTAGLNMGDLTEDSSTIFDLNSSNVSFPPTSGDETILAVGLRDIQPVDTISLKENTQIASPASPLSGVRKKEVSGAPNNRNAEPFDLLTLTGSRADSYSLRIPTFRLPSDIGVFESQEAQ